MGIAGILLGGGGLLWELWELLRPEPRKRPRRCIQRRGASNVFGGGLLALGVLQHCNPQPWLPYLMGGLLAGLLAEGFLRRPLSSSVFLSKQPK